MAGSIPFQASPNAADIGRQPVDGAVAGPVNGNPHSPPLPVYPNSPRPRARSTRPFGRSRPLVIGQDVLREYRLLCEAEKQRKEMRKLIVDSLEAGTVIESGPLTAHLRQFEERRFSAHQLARLLGQAEVERLRRLLQSTVSVHLIVEPMS